MSAAAVRAPVVRAAAVTTPAMRAPAKLANLAESNIQLFERRVSLGDKCKRWLRDAGAPPERTLQPVRQRERIHHILEGGVRPRGPAQAHCSAQVPWQKFDCFLGVSEPAAEAAQVV